MVRAFVGRFPVVPGVLAWPTPELSEEEGNPLMGGTLLTDGVRMAGATVMAVVSLMAGALLMAGVSMTAGAPPMAGVSLTAISPLMMAGASMTAGTPEDPGSSRVPGGLQETPLVLEMSSAGSSNDASRISTSSGFSSS